MYATSILAMSTAYLTSRAYRGTVPGMAEKDPRVILPIPRELLRRVDDFRFDNRLNSRAEAIRLLLQRGLDAAPKPVSNATATERPARRRA
jgi:hypothetical protein